MTPRPALSALVIFSLCAVAACPAWASHYSSPESIPGATTINAEDLIELAGTTHDLIIIDSRINTDRRKGYIEDSVHLVDTDTNCDSLSRLAEGRDTPLVFYCNGVNCDRSDTAAAIAYHCGYTRIYWFRGGIEEWSAKHYPLVR